MDGWGQHDGIYQINVPTGSLVAPLTKRCPLCAAGPGGHEEKEDFLARRGGAPSALGRLSVSTLIFSYPSLILKCFLVFFFLSICHFLAEFLSIFVHCSFFLFIVFYSTHICSTAHQCL